jgi:hypothetical protein
MTPFCAAAVAFLKKQPLGSASAYALREAMMDQGFGKHPAGVAMNLTKLAFRGEYITSYIDNQDSRVFVLTAKGKAS